MSSSPFKTNSQPFTTLLGPSPTLQLLLSHDAYPFAHEACVYVPSSDTLFVTSNSIPDPTSPSSGNKKIIISKISFSPSRDPSIIQRDEINPSPIIPMPNGGVNYIYPSPSTSSPSILLCAQGTSDASPPSGLYLLSTQPPYTSQPLITSFQGRPFNSPNDVVFEPPPPSSPPPSSSSSSSSAAAIWFTDPPYGHVQGFRPKPSLPAQVYRYDVSTGDIRAVADGFHRPNGLCFSPDGETLYVTDTGAVGGDGGGLDWGKEANIYAFTVTHYHGQPFLENRRLFAYCSDGVPDGIKCDTKGNVYSGCGDGLHVWSPGGVLLGKIAVEGGVANFCFGKPGEIFLLNEHKLWRANLDGSVVEGALLNLSAGGFGGLGGIGGVVMGRERKGGGGQYEGFWGM